MSELRVDKIATREGNKSIGTDVLIDSLDRQVSLELSLEESKMVTGFVDRVTSTITNTSTSITFKNTNEQPCIIYKHGKRYEFIGSVTLDIGSNLGGYYVIFNETQYTLSLKAGNPDFANDILVAWVYITPVDGIIWCGDERHNCSRNFEWHKAQHLDMGAVWRSGGIAQYTASDQSNLKFGFTNPIRIADEDLEHIIIHSNTPAAPYEQYLSTYAKVPVLYLDGLYYKQTLVTDNPFMQAAFIGTRAKYNRVIGGSGDLIDALNNTYVPYHVVFTNDMTNPVKLIMGRGGYANLEDALSEEFDSYGIPMPEIVPVYKIVLHINDTYTDNPAKAVLSAMVRITTRQSSLQAAYVPDSHNVLIDRDMENQHPISAITGLQAILNNINSAIGGAGSIGDQILSINAQLSSLQTSLAAKLVKESNLSDVSNKATARTNLGLGTASTLNGTADDNGFIRNGTKHAVVRDSNLADLSNIASARNNLGLGNIATKNQFLSTGNPTGGASGDVWYKF